MDTHPVSKVFLDAKELAHMLSVKVPTIRKWCTYSDIPRVSVGRLIRFEIAAVTDWIKNGGPSRLHNDPAGSSHER
jgi:excisionase family DNA binding protein